MAAPLDTDLNKGLGTASITRSGNGFSWIEKELLSDHGPCAVNVIIRGSTLMGGYGTNDQILLFSVNDGKENYVRPLGGKYRKGDSVDKLGDIWRREIAEKFETESPTLTTLLKLDIEHSGKVFKNLCWRKMAKGHPESADKIANRHEVITFDVEVTSRWIQTFVTHFEPSGRVTDVHVIDLPSFASLIGNNEAYLYVKPKNLINLGKSSILIRGGKYDNLKLPQWWARTVFDLSKGYVNFY